MVNKVVKPSSVRRQAARSVSMSSTLEYCSTQSQFFAGGDVRQEAGTVAANSYGRIVQQKSGGAVQKVACSTRPPPGVEMPGSLKPPAMNGYVMFRTL